ncbi:hypothetical protein FGO68_gene15432 [Halteria grandinella]|uniref:Uncharacterized protein n=1 Tax=Halteria grandinella TaxID=5974 RepID=A0A8J8NP48_HALGN|nr:hypothetical protein FGO68_gene15432 [Halteria grandinella]
MWFLDLSYVLNDLRSLMDSAFFLPNSRVNVSVLSPSISFFLQNRSQRDISPELIFLFISGNSITACLTASFFALVISNANYSLCFSCFIQRIDFACLSFDRSQSCFLNSTR